MAARLHSRTFVVIASLAVVLTVASRHTAVGLPGMTYVKTDGTWSFTFNSDTVTRTMIPENNELDVRLPGVGEEVLDTSADLPSSPEVYLTLCRGSDGLETQFFLLPAGGSFTFRTDGTIANSDGTPVDSLGGSVIDTAPLREKAEDLLEDLYKSNGVGACHYADDGTKLLHEEAVPKIVETLRNGGSEAFCVVFRCTSEVVYRTGAKVDVAVEPVRYERTTVTVDDGGASFLGPFQGKAMEAMKAKLGAARNVYRVEDDGNFLFNPETESRWKREP